MSPDITRLFGGRDWRGQTIAVLGVALGAAVLGFAAGSLGRQVQSTRLARAEAASASPSSMRSWTSARPARASSRPRSRSCGRP